MCFNYKIDGVQYSVQLPLSQVTSISIFRELGFEVGAESLEAAVVIPKPDLATCGWRRWWMLWYTLDSLDTILFCIYLHNVAFLWSPTLFHNLQNKEEIAHCTHQMMRVTFSPANWRQVRSGSIKCNQETRHRTHHHMKP